MKKNCFRCGKGLQPVAYSMSSISGWFRVLMDPSEPVEGIDEQLKGLLEEVPTIGPKSWRKMSTRDLIDQL